MNLKYRWAAALVLLALGAAPAFAEPPAQIGRTTEQLELFSTASVRAKVVARLEQGEPFRVLETSPRDEAVDGKKGRWLRVSTADGQEGWLHDVRVRLLTEYLGPGDFESEEAYGRYLALALRKGERVRAVRDYEKVREGDLGWYHSADEGEPPILVVWDRDLDATPWVEAIPKDCPRILSGRIYFIHPGTIEIAGEEKLADFDDLGREWHTTAPAETLFPLGSRVILGEHRRVDKDDADSANWNEDMAEFVGKETLITRQLGADPWGRSVAAVDVDDGRYSWRTEDMELVERGSGTADEGSDYDYGEEDYSYEDYDEEDLALEEAFPVGSRVILGRHLQLDPEDEESAYWAEEMDDYVGREARITEHAGLCPWGEPTARVDLDDGDYYWRLSDMELLEEGPGYREDDEEDFEDYEDYRDGEYGEDSAGMIREGLKVVLGRHDEVNGDANWVDEMEEFVGLETTVREILGTDSQGFLVVSVEGNDWSWRIRNLAVQGRGEAGSYGFQVGDLVVLRRHRSVDGNQNWNPSMDEFVGKKAKITELVGTGGDVAGCFLVRVDLDNGEWVWRVESLTPAE